MQNPKEFAQEQEAQLTPQEQVDRERCLQSILTFNGPSQHLPEPVVVNPPSQQTVQPESN